MSRGESCTVRPRSHNRSWAEGQAMTQEQAIAYALADSTPA
jgi:hypothetical protein